ncbi:hypothetical protein N7535_002787 [Penicillium sp. DV-2018c]|nr:hypothetical protein N7535_002787 [Penicillium sp. DV-2018c]
MSFFAIPDPDHYTPDRNDNENGRARSGYGDNGSQPQHGRLAGASLGQIRGSLNEVRGDELLNASFVLSEMLSLSNRQETFTVSRFYLRKTTKHHKSKR